MRAPNVLDDPLVRHHLQQRDARPVVALQQLRNQVARLERHPLRVGDVQLPDLRVRALRVLRLEWRPADEELVAQNAQAPLVDRVVVALAIDHLRRQVVERAAHRLALVRLGVRRPAEVGQLHVVVGGQHDVLRLQVAVDDVIAVAVVQRVGHLVRVLGGARLVEAAVGRRLQVLVQLALAGQLDGQIDALVVVEPRVQAQDVRVPAEERAGGGGGGGGGL